MFNCLFVLTRPLKMVANITYLYVDNTKLIQSKSNNSELEHDNLLKEGWSAESGMRLCLFSKGLAISLKLQTVSSIVRVFVSFSHFGKYHDAR